MENKFKKFSTTGVQSSSVNTENKFRQFRALEPQDAVSSLEDLLPSESQPQQPSEKPSAASEFITGLKAGTAQTGALLTEALPALAARSLGFSEYAQEQIEDYGTKLKEIQEKYPRAANQCSCNTCFC